MLSFYDDFDDSDEMDASSNGLNKHAGERSSRRELYNYPEPSSPIEIFY